MKLIEIIAVLVAANLVLTIFNNLKLNQIMAKSQERFDLLMGRLDKVSNDIAADYAQLLKAVQEGADSVSEESFAKHEANIDKLEALGASVENPVPEPPAPPES